MPKLTENALKKAISLRCKDCNPDKDKELCNKCFLQKKENLQYNVLRYCKWCRNGNPLEFCGSEKTCPLYPYMPEVVRQSAEKIQNKKED